MLISGTVKRQDGKSFTGTLPSLAAYTGSGATLPLQHFTDGRFTLADLNGDGLDEIITEDRGGLVALKTDGSYLPGWPIGEAHAPIAVADIDGDGMPNIVSGISSMYAYHSDGTLMQGFPVSHTPNTSGIAAYPVIGDVDGDGIPEIISAITDYSPEPKGDQIVVISNKGVIKLSIVMGRTYGIPVMPVLADLNCDGVPEIVIQTINNIYVFKDDGTPFPGWPLPEPTPSVPRFITQMPVVGDVDGDGRPDIVTVARSISGPTTQELVAYDRNGKLLPRFPKLLPIGTGVAPTIADLDGDGRNEIVLASNTTDELWVFDLHGPKKYGPIEWGQFGGGPQRQNAYKPDKRACTR